MASSDANISEVLERYGETFNGNCWRVQGTAVIYHKALERIAAKAGIVFIAPTIIRAERDEAVLLVTGRLIDPKSGAVREEWSLGEAVVNVNYRVSGKQAAYVYAMAEKRGKDRVILKLIELSGLVYSEEEADEFKDEPAPEEPAPGPMIVSPRALNALERAKQIALTKTTSGAILTWWQSDEVQAWAQVHLSDDEYDEADLFVSERANQLLRHEEKKRAVQKNAA